MGLKATARLRALNHLAGNAATSGPITHMSLHTAFPATDGNELTGGSPAYARKAITWEAVAGTELAGSLDMTNAPVFDVASGSVVAAIGGYTASTAGTLMVDAPAGGGALKSFNTDDIATDVLDSPAHGFTDTQTVVVIGASLPTGISEGTIYYVRDATTDSLKLALTSGGAAINLTAIGYGFLQRIITETFGGQGTYTVTDFDLALS